MCKDVYLIGNAHEFTYSLFPYENISSCERKAAELNFGVRRVMGSFHKGNLPETMSCVECDGQNIIITAIKQHQECDKTVLRLYEAEGKDTLAQVKLFGKTISVTVSP